MKEYPHLEKLDMVLKIINDQYKSFHEVMFKGYTSEEELTKAIVESIKEGDTLNIGEIHRYCYERNPKMKFAIAEKEISLIVAYLLEENYISEEKIWIQKGTAYAIKYRGKIVTETGGLLQRQIDKDRDRERLKTLEEETSTSNQRMTRWTKRATLVAFGLLLWEMWKWAFPILNDFLIFLCCNRHATKIVLSIAIIVIFSLSIYSNRKK